MNISFYTTNSTTDQMDSLLFLVSIIGFAPALGVVWFSLRKYDHPYVKGTCFDDRRVFFLLALGMVAGTILLMMERLVYPLFKVVGDNGDIGFSPTLFFIFYVVALGLVHTLSKFVILNFPSIQGRIDSQFYGVSLGAGISATWIVGFSYIQLTVEGGAGSAAILSSLALLSLNTALIHASVGAVLGVSTAKNEGMRGILWGLAPHMIFNAMMFPWFYYDVIWYSLLLATPITLIIYYEVYTNIIPKSLPEEIQHEIKENDAKAKASGKKWDIKL